ncbi:MAG TPA: hypothetical protein VM686_06825 [Polyangiaceae bacterium]|nr:hypothetical protein [Polyangiaceae bacterium]
MAVLGAVAAALNGLGSIVWATWCAPKQSLVALIVAVALFVATIVEAGASLPVGGLAAERRLSPSDGPAPRELARKMGLRPFLKKRARCCFSSNPWGMCAGNIVQSSTRTRIVQIFDTE